MIRSVALTKFRGFEQLHVDLLPSAYIVGPNSAGKSTVLEAIALSMRCLRVARRRVPHESYEDGGMRRRGFPLAAAGYTEADPIRHDFAGDEARAEIIWENGASITVVWPDEAMDRSPFFFLRDSTGRTLVTPASAKSNFTIATVIPVITPLDHLEPLKDREYIEQHSGTRLASRHFRNHVYQMHRAGTWQAFRSFCSEWLPELDILDVNFSVEANRLSVFYAERGSRVPKELAWAGDGIQIWIQLLWHLYEARDSETVVLDEPEVYLHPDLQRRLVRLLETQSRQVILASHSAEVIAEAPADAIVWVDRRSIGARRTNSDRSLKTLSQSLGSRFNLALARSMRSRLTVVSDCRDLRVIRTLAKSVGANKIANEQEVSFIQLGDAMRQLRPPDLVSGLRSVLPKSVHAVVVLQRLLRTENEVDILQREVQIPGVRLFVLSQNELENYLLEPDAISRVSGIDRTTAALRLTEIASRLKETSRKAYLFAGINALPPSTSAASAVASLESEFDRRWMKSSFPAELISGSAAIRELNSDLRAAGYKEVNVVALAKALKPQHMPPELMALLLELNDLAGA